MSDTNESAPKLEAIPGGKAEEGAEPKPTIQTEKVIRMALSKLRKRHQIVSSMMTEVSAGRFDWREVARSAHDLDRIEAQVEALRFVLCEAETIR